MESNMTSNKNDSDSPLKVGSPEYAWRYFELHANQRISLFRNFVFILTVYITGIGLLITNFHDSSCIEEIAAFSLSVVFIFVSIIFYLLDARNRHLIHIAERSLRKHEDADTTINKTHKIFLREKRKCFCGPRHTLCFKILFGTAIAAAILVICSSAFHGFYESSNCAHTKTINYYNYNQSSNGHVRE